jgi:hypothetical protein
MVDTELAVAKIAAVDGSGSLGMTVVRTGLVACGDRS